MKTTDIYTARRAQLQQAVIDASLALCEHEGCAGFNLPIKGTTPPVSVTMGMPAKAIPIGEDTGLPLYRPPSAALVAVGEQHIDLRPKLEEAISDKVTAAEDLMCNQPHFRANTRYAEACDELDRTLDRVFSRLSLPVEAREVTISMDVSTGDENAGHRIFGRVEGSMLDANGKTVLLAVEESRNFGAKNDA